VRIDIRGESQPSHGTVDDEADYAEGEWVENASGAMEFRMADGSVMSMEEWNASNAAPDAAAPAGDGASAAADGHDSATAADDTTTAADATTADDTATAVATATAEGSTDDVPGELVAGETNGAGDGASS
jgi:hypothetical protein